MSFFKIKAAKRFQREFKFLAKKFPSLRQEIVFLQKQLQENPTIGTPFGRNCYKIRLAIASKGRGKSGGGRVITYVAVVQETVYLLTIYDKSEQADLDPHELDALLTQLDVGTADS